STTVASSRSARSARSPDALRPPPPPPDRYSHPILRAPARTAAVDGPCLREGVPMTIHRAAAVMAGLALHVATPSAALAHGLIGQRFFPATLAIDDPFVADELSLPMVSFMPFGRSGDTPAFRLTDISAEFSKRLTPDLGFSIAGDLSV